MNPEGQSIVEESALDIEKRQLRNDLLYAIRENNTERLEELRAVYAERHPEESPLVEFAVRMHDYIENNIRTAGSRLIEDREERKKFIFKKLLDLF